MTTDEMLHTHLMFGGASVLLGVAVLYWLRLRRQGRAGSPRAVGLTGWGILIVSVGIIVLYGLFVRAMQQGTP